MSGFVVQGLKSDDRDSSGSKNRLFPFFYQQDPGLPQLLSMGRTSGAARVSDLETRKITRGQQ